MAGSYGLNLLGGHAHHRRTAAQWHRTHSSPFYGYAQAGSSPSMAVSNGYGHRRGHLAHLTHGSVFTGKHGSGARPQYSALQPDAHILWPPLAPPPDSR